MFKNRTFKLLALITAIALLGLTACSGKKVADSNDFIERMEAKEYQVSDQSDVISIPGIRESYVAEKEGIRIEFSIFDNNIEAEEYYKTAREVLENITMSDLEIVDRDDSYCVKTPSGYYFVEVDKDHTIYSAGESTKADEAIKCIKALGY